jgi:hypothetical protein
MKLQDAHVGRRVKLADHHRIEQRTGLVGTVGVATGEKSTWS